MIPVSISTSAALTLKILMYFLAAEVLWYYRATSTLPAELPEIVFHSQAITMYTAVPKIPVDMYTQNYGTHI